MIDQQELQDQGQIRREPQSQVQAQPKFLVTEKAGFRDSFPLSNLVYDEEQRICKIKAGIFTMAAIEMLPKHFEEFKAEVEKARDKNVHLILKTGTQEIKFRIVDSVMGILLGTIYKVWGIVQAVVTYIKGVAHIVWNGLRAIWDKTRGTLMVPEAIANQFSEEEKELFAARNISVVTL